MAIITLVRHGQAAANWQQDSDPGLSLLGQQQAEECATTLALSTAQTLCSSPKLRAQETAKPLAEHWQQDVSILAAATEIPSVNILLAERGVWLKQVFQQRWSEQGAPVQQWRRELMDSLLGLNSDHIIFSHFVVINAVIGFARDSQQVFQYQPDYCSIHRFDNSNGKLTTLELGDEDQSIVL